MSEQYRFFIYGKRFFITLKFRPGPESWGGWGSTDTEVYICESDGQPYLASIHGTGRSTGPSTFAPEIMELEDYHEITYEDLISLAEESYPGIAQEYEGINETNWQDYVDVYSCYRTREQFRHSTTAVLLLEINPGPACWQGWAASVYFDKELEGLYLVAAKHGKGELVDKQKLLRSDCRQITFEQMLALAEEAYPGIAQEYDGINETNWQKYTNVCSDYHKRLQKTKTNSRQKYYTNFRNLLADYCEIDGLQIVRLLDLDIFFAIRNSGWIADSTVAYYLSREERKALKNKTLKAEDFYRSEFAWVPLSEFEEIYTPDAIAELVEYNQKKKQEAMNASSTEADSEKPVTLMDLFVDYCELDGLRIVRVLNLNIFFAIRNGERSADHFDMHLLRSGETKALLSNKLTAKDLEQSEATWGEIYEFESSLPVSEMIDAAKQKGFSQQCPECRTVMDSQARFCQHCGKAVEIDGKTAHMNDTFEQLYAASVKEVELKKLKTKPVAVKAPLANSDFFVYCGKLNGTQIVRLLDFNKYYAVTNKDGDANNIIIYYISPYELKELLNGKETIRNLYKQHWAWQSLKSYDCNRSLINAPLSRAVRKGFTQICLNCGTHADFHARFCPHCGTSIRYTKQPSQTVIDACVTKLTRK